MEKGHQHTITNTNPKGSWNGCIHIRQSRFQNKDLADLDLWLDL